jgi:hypothetical protein
MQAPQGHVKAASVLIMISTAVAETVVLQCVHCKDQGKLQVILTTLRGVQSYCWTA